MPLTDLPDELLYDIAKSVSQACPDDIENIGRASGRLRLVCWPLIKEHRKALKAHTTLSCHSKAAADFFFTICKKPWVAFYPRSLEVWANKHLRTLQRPKTVKHIAMIDAFKAKRDTVSDEEIEDVITRTGLIHSTQTSTWIEEIRKGNEDYLFAILLACLPKLKRFVVHLDLEKMEQLKEMVRNVKKEWPRRPSLPDLENVQVREKEGARNCDLELFPLLASIPSVQNLHASNLTGMYRECYRDGWHSYPGASPSITSIRLETCGMSVEGLETLMKSLRGLEEFQYVAHRAGWGLHAVSSLLKNSLDSLHTLVISTGGGSSRYIGTLRGFTVLKHVTVDTDMLVKNGKMQRFVDIMPASLETCTVAGNNMTKPMETQFLADLFRANFFFPRLRRISAEDSWGMRNIGQDRLKFQKEFHKQTIWMSRYK